MGRYLLYRMHPLSVGEALRTDLPTKEIQPPAEIAASDWNALWERGGFPEPFYRRDTRFTRRRPGRPSLALDLMEELRPVLTDRLTLTLINRRQVQAGDFRKSESGAVLLEDAARKEVLIAWQKRKQEEIQHPFLGERIELGLLPHVQAL